MERFVSRLGLAVYSASTPKERVLARFHRESEAAIALVQTLSEEVAEIPMLIPRPIGIEDSSRHWSAAMVLEHLVTVNLNGLHRRQIETIVMRRSKTGDAKGISSGRF